MDKKYIDDFFSSIPIVEMTEKRHKEIQEQYRKDDIKYYNNRNEKGYLNN